jgi:glycosyltransferase involved in cell wall biosynthesis
MKVIGSWHTELAAYASTRSGAKHLERMVNQVLRVFYGQSRVVLSPSPASDDTLLDLGIEPDRIARWGRGVDTSRFDPAKAASDRYPGEIKILYAGRISEEKGIRLLADAFLIAAADDPRLHLLLAGGGPDEELIRGQLGERATFLGWLHGGDLAEAYASCDIFCFPSSTDTFGQVVAEAGASGLPVVAVDRGGPRSLVQHGVTGLLCEPDASVFAGAIRRLADAPGFASELGSAGVRGARVRTWERSMAQLGEGYRIALSEKRGVLTDAAPPLRADLRAA